MNTPAAPTLINQTVRRRLAGLLLAAGAALLCACSTPQIHSTTQIMPLSLTAAALRQQGLAFLTPSSVTGQEEDRQALALAFADVLHQQRPDVRSVSLPETLGAINRAGLSGQYKQMVEDYRLTGLFDRDTLRTVAGANGVRYLAVLKLGGFRQEAKSRWGAFGLRLLETKSTTIRLYLQIWDGEDGSVAWEGAQELNFSHDSMAEDATTFRGAVEQAARELISRLP